MDAPDRRRRRRTPASDRRAAARRPPAEPLVIAADGGALKAESLGFRPHVVVGDLDSLAPDDTARLRSAGEVHLHPADKDESDTELALREALDRGAPSDGHRSARSADGASSTASRTSCCYAARALPGATCALVDRREHAARDGGPDGDRLEIGGVAGDYVSLLPLSGRVEGVTTTGLAYPLIDEELLEGAARGLSNELIGERASITTRRGRLLVVHTRRAEA